MSLKLDQKCFTGYDLPKGYHCRSDCYSEEEREVAKKIYEDRARLGQEAEVVHKVETKSAAEIEGL